MPTPGTVVSIAVGAASAVATEHLLRRRAPRHRVLALGVGLPVAAAIYPAARRSDARHSSHAAREVAALAGYSALALAAGRDTPARGGRLLAAGWASHALFDNLHDRGHGSAIPSWYPALCAGYDVVIAAGLLQRPAALS